ncbi:MAG: peptidoglycan editing factor PgeF [Pseudomonadota bacterium]|nr:peptidoglycan editing factor PgeF [Pseudomonadota bacterium]
MTTRRGGRSVGPYASMNLGAGVGDAPHSVAANRALFAAACGAAPVYLRQLHGTCVVQVGSADAAPAAPMHDADASVTTEPGVACTVLVADCLPVLFAAPAGRAVAAAHAGWRGLAAGVLEATVAALCTAARCEPAELQAWLGACIGPDAFEVGVDVVQAFGVDAGAAAPFGFRPIRPGKWLADLPALARARLEAAGVRQVGGGEWCTVADASRFFSFRRDGSTGRMAAAVWIDRRARG